MNIARLIVLVFMCLATASCLSLLPIRTFGMSVYNESPLEVSVFVFFDDKSRSEYPIGPHNRVLIDARRSARITSIRAIRRGGGSVDLQVPYETVNKSGELLQLNISSDECWFSYAKR